jgi:hypothetical protein
MFHDLRPVRVGSIVKNNELLQNARAMARRYTTIP